VILDEGFSFTFNAQGWGVFTDGFSGGGAPYTHNGTTRLVASGDQSNTHAYVDIAQIGGAPFSLSSFDGATMFPGFRGRIEVIGSLDGGGTVNAFFDLTDTFSPFVLPGSFVNLDSVRVFDTFSAGFRAGPGSFSVDNLVVNTAAVPEPQASCSSVPVSWPPACAGARRQKRGTDRRPNALRSFRKPASRSRVFVFDGDDAGILGSRRPGTRRLWVAGCRSERGSA
jgi:hypothetical protein